ncbi:MAG: type I restriction-modification system subunit M N-terminal domain-containing protein [Terrimicrobiaceae bacterium]
MQWIAPSEKDADNAVLEKRLWDAANQLWAGAGLKQSEYSEPVLGLIFLRFAEVRFSAQRKKLELPTTGSFPTGRGKGESAQLGRGADSCYHHAAIAIGNSWAIAGTSCRRKRRNSKNIWHCSP